MIVRHFFFFTAFYTCTVITFVTLAYITYSCNSIRRLFDVVHRQVQRRDTYVCMYVYGKKSLFKYGKCVLLERKKKKKEMYTYEES